MKENKKLISRKEVLKQLGVLSVGVPLVPGYFGKASFFNHTQGPYNAKDMAPLFPFQITHNSPDNITNFEHLLDAPAGKHGFIRAENGQFVHDAGRMRLNGTNLTGPANFPSKTDAESLANRLAALGINCVRLHYMDADYGNFLQPKEQGIIAHDPKTQRNLDAQQLDRLDYLVSVFKKKGIYVDMNLHVARWWDDRDGFPYQDQRPVFDKGLDNFEPRMIDLQKEYARKLLTHVNPYTSLPYTDEPAVAVIEMNNENSLFSQYFGGHIDKLPDPYAAEFRSQWNAWLTKKYETTVKLKNAWEADNDPSIQLLLANGQTIEEASVPTVKAGSVVPIQVKKDFYQFITDTEHAYWTGMYRFLKEELNVKSVVSGTQLTYYGTPFIQSQLDYCDNHAYWCHPHPVSPDWRMIDKAMVNSMDNVQIIASQRVLGKPYTVSEYNHPFPNQYGAEGQPIIRAYGSLQGWDGIFEYTYHHRSDYKAGYNSYFFSIMDRTDVLAHFPACSAIFLRGDVLEAKSVITGGLDYDKYFKHLTGKNTVRAGIETCGLDINHTLVHKTVVDLTGKNSSAEAVNNEINGKKKLVSDTGELVWNHEKTGAGYFIVNTANTKLFTGFPDGREIKLGDIILSIGKTRLNWATVSLVSKNETGFGEQNKPASILLTATGIVQNNGMVIVQEADDKIRLSDWGSAPVYAEGIPAELTFPIDSGRVKCYVLDANGNRKEQIAIRRKGKNKIQISLKPEYQTVWYEIAIS